jgi:hypothetical protein
VRENRPEKISVITVQTFYTTFVANSKEGQARAADIIKNWIRTRTTLEFLGTWEQMYNPDFKVVEFDHFKMQAD